MALPIPTALCTPADLALYVSDSAVALRTDDADTTAAVAQAISRATGDVLYYCWRYDPSSLVGIGWVTSKTITIAAWYLAGRRMNGRSDAVKEDYAEAVKQLEEVRTGAARIPGANMPKSAVPTVTNVNVNMQRFPAIRTTRPNSTGRAEGYAQHTDPTADAINRG